MLLGPVGIEPATAWSPVGCTYDWATVAGFEKVEGGILLLQSIHLFIILFITFYLLYFIDTPLIWCYVYRDTHFI